MKTILLAFFLLLIFNTEGKTQPEKKWIKYQTGTLAGQKFLGRGYVKHGAAKAAGYLQRKYKEIGLLAFDEDSYFQSYNFPVNTFPGEMSITINKKHLTPGVDFIIHESSKGIRTQKSKIKTIDVKNIKDSIGWNNVLQSFEPQKSYLIKNFDTPRHYLNLSRRKWIKDLPEAAYIIPKKGKLIWSVATDTVGATIVFVEDSILPKRSRKITMYIENRFEPSYKNNNVIGYLKGKKYPDSFYVFTAHYDHLGMMGRNTVFPGAHDNASGTALMLYMASYFAQHSPDYSIAFIAFSGEEAGLKGSQYYVNNPKFPLDNIKLVINLDMTGDVTKGITVVNAVEQKNVYQQLLLINQEKNYLSEIKERTQAANSDHYSFSQKGVPAIFIYGMGAKGHYHDVFDKANELTFNKIEYLVRLLKDFIEKF